MPEADTQNQQIQAQQRPAAPGLRTRPSSGGPKRVPEETAAVAAPGKKSGWVKKALVPVLANALGFGFTYFIS